MRGEPLVHPRVLLSNVLPWEKDQKNVGKTWEDLTMSDFIDKDEDRIGWVVS